MRRCSGPSKRPPPSRAPRLALAVAVGLWWAGDGGAARAAEPAPPAPRSEVGPSAAPILAALERLESGHDAKCHSTASRFEDFLYGTPLGDDGRSANIEQQKRLVRRLWSRASASAAAAGRAAVGSEHLEAEAARLFARERSADGALRVTFPGAGPLAQAERAAGRSSSGARPRRAESIELDPVRARQYGDIAYSLRAILAVQQDSLFGGGELLLTLSPEATLRLEDAVDTLALAALLLADRDARERSEPRIGAERMRAAWARLVPEAPPTDANGGPRLAAAPDARAQALALLDDLVARKTAAYRAYNGLESRDTRALFLANTARFYARAPLPRPADERKALVATFTARVDEWSAALLRESEREARAAGHPLVRAADANAALQRLVPHEIDEYEDVHVFPKLSGDERVSLEAYDCDSLRDFGVHWPSLARAAHAAPPEAPLPDPFAAEILAEGISQYGVLLLRVAGGIAKGDTESVRLHPPDLARAAEAIRERARRHHAAPARPPAASRIASARGGAAPPAAAYFSEVTDAAGVGFEHRSSRWLGEFRHTLLKTPPTFSGGGVAAEDVDGDSDVDLLFVGGGGNALLLNDGRGGFADQTKAAGIALLRPDGSHGEPRQPLIVDFDNDGLQDILITYVDDDHRLYRNAGGGRFEDVSAASGLGGKGLVGGPATAFDFDGDGLLDLYLGYFGDYLHGAIPSFDRNNRGALPNRLFRNLGGLRFADVTKGSGADDTGWTQAVSHVDFDRDGRQDLIVANDYGRNAFLRNLGGGRFEDRAPALGITKAFHSMNVGVADLNDDDHPDIYISNIAMLVKDDKYIFPDVNTPLHFDLRAMANMRVKESDVLYMSRVEEDRLVAYEPSTDVERGPTSTGWAWDAEFFDFDHDGDDDLYLVNGDNDFHAFAMVYRRKPAGVDEGEYLIGWGGESKIFFENEGGRLRNASARSGADFVGNSRSTSYLDFEGDGDLDIAVNNFHAKARLFRNNAEVRALHWLKVRLVGDPARGSNRDAIGARIVATTADGLRVRRWVQGGSGYLSMNPKQQHLGLGRARSADLRIVWPNGDEETLRGLAADRAYTVRQGAGAAELAPSLQAGLR